MTQLCTLLACGAAERTGSAQQVVAALVLLLFVPILMYVTRGGDGPDDR